MFCFVCTLEVVVLGNVVVVRLKHNYDVQLCMHSPVRRQESCLQKVKLSVSPADSQLAQTQLLLPLQILQTRQQKYFVNWNVSPISVSPSSAISSPHPVFYSPCRLRTDKMVIVIECIIPISCDIFSSYLVSDLV